MLPLSADVAVMTVASGAQGDGEVGKSDRSPSWKLGRKPSPPEPEARMVQLESGPQRDLSLPLGYPLVRALPVSLSLRESSARSVE